MDPPLTSPDPLYMLTGFVVGALVGQTGVGGGSLMTPLLVLLFGVHPSVAVGTDLLFAAVTKSVATLMHGRHGTIDWRVTLRLAAGSVPATIATLLLLSQTALFSDQMARLLAAILAATLILTGCTLLLGDPVRLLRHARRLAGIGRAHSARAATSPQGSGLQGRRAWLLTVAAGVALGIFVPLTSIGAGALGIVALILLYPEQRLAALVGADIAHAVPLTLLAGLGHWLVGSVDLGLLVTLLAGSLPGVILGSLLAGRTPQFVLRPMLGLLLLAVGLKMATTYF